MESLTLQAFLSNQWVDIAYITFPDSDINSYLVSELEYQSDYAIENLDRDDNHAVSLNHPVSLFFEDNGQPGWLRFLDDIIPSGASKRYWENYLDLAGLTADQKSFVLLKHGTISPVGNLRIKESLPEYYPLAETLFFTVDDVKNRAGDFLDYAQQRGATAGGATGAGGEAPKLLLRCSQDQRIWIDTWQNDLTNRDIHYLVKYPRGSRSEVDCNILRAEFHYYHELETMGFDTIPTRHMRLEEGLNYPSLWLPRFDIAFVAQNQVKRFGMESVYSLLKKSPGVTLYHEETIRALIDKITHSNMVTGEGFHFDIAAFVIEWVRRDLLNIIFGNSDNHGRNTSFIKDEQSIRLAPIYDFAPMKADPEGIARTTKWVPPLEIGGEYDFAGIAGALADLVPADKLLQALKVTAQQLVKLKQRLQARGVPEQILEMPAINLNFIAEKLTRWNLL
ncbi:HipA domain-containing protein [Erwiniaceae bacterium BAC15a-03b]|uniref:HipA domain-containing protein n=1 Tax=Winslowiella arboricola TaxID=2978220 RepID=A0A9J6PZ03_9GAMM|nr:HipA domain-containing protein [Winslowiella arboricola]MCU5772900.1 HipA domain-containing protein [Winslowiella arboricola]MCU5780672.1 HipA domain-containing protein [Winslowiella arboricola]